MQNFSQEVIHTILRNRFATDTDIVTNRFLRNVMNEDHDSLIYDTSMIQSVSVLKVLSWESWKHPLDFITTSSKNNQSSLKED